MRVMVIGVMMIIDKWQVGDEDDSLIRQGVMIIIQYLTGW